MLNKSLRLNEYAALFYRLFLAYLFYQISRILFYAFNTSILHLESIKDLLKLCWHGFAFDTTAILYINSLFIILSVFPFNINTKPSYQKALKIFYFSTNLIFYATNFVDIIYYRFSQTRSTRSTLDLLKDEDNATSLFVHFFTTYWYILLLFVVCAVFWVYLYQKVIVRQITYNSLISYFSFSVVGVLLIATMAVGGIRGDFRHSTRPINMVDAYRHVTIPNQGDIVMNTPFAIFRTLKIKEYKIPQWVDNNYIKNNIKPIKHYHGKLKGQRPNVVILILESMGREYWGSMNKESGIAAYKSHTPFLDSLSSQSLVFTNAYANGRQSIHGMSSILAGIPSFQHAFTSSPYAKQDIQSIVSISNSLGYETSFFHGAANGSMGFLGFSNILGFDKYYGRTEYNNDQDYDEIWGIWDEPFFQFMGKTLSQQKQPFMSTLFSLSSHDPYKIPEKYHQKFKEGGVPIHKCVEYTDYALKQFFSYAKKQSWYNNTIFVFTADHTNQNYYEEYNNSINRFAVPIMFFSPNATHHLKGRREDLAQQIDIYPTLVDLIGYERPFRSWGRSLVANLASEKPRVINSPGNVYQFIQDNYIYIFDGDKFTGIFDLSDKKLENNLLSQQNKITQTGMKDCRAFIQTYMYQIANKKLNSTKTIIASK